MGSPVQTTPSRIHYLTVPPEVRRLGSWCVTVGTARTGPGDAYPPDGRRHPRTYRDVSEAGRTLNELQIVYVADGAGRFEEEGADERDVTAGSCLLLRPGRWHRYRPLPDVGWTEYWVGVRGSAVLDAVGTLGLADGSAVVSVRDPEAIVWIFARLLELAAVHDLVSHVEMVGEALRLLSRLAREAGPDTARSGTDDSIARALSVLQSRVGERVNLGELARECGVSDATFRRLFRLRTGSSPYRYFMTLKVNAAKHELAHSELPLKAIADRLGFTDQYHLSRVFKEYVGFAPSEWRARGG